MAEAIKSIGERARLAIEWECTSIKLGNVHPTESFEDLSYPQFLMAARAIGQQIHLSVDAAVGEIAKQCTEAMMRSVSTNTSLGTILLLAPLVVAMRSRDRRIGDGSELLPWLQVTLAGMNSQDAEDIYAAIRIAKPGGLGQVEELDVATEAPKSILDAMQLASQWDDIAMQYVTGFQLVFELASRLKCKFGEVQDWTIAIRGLQIELMSERIDSLIARKQGVEFARDVQKRARGVLESGSYGSPAFEKSWRSLDAFLRDSKHRGNPGTTADLLAAAVFVSLG